MLDALPSDVLHALVHSRHVERLEDRLALLLSCKAVLRACGGVDARTGRVAADGGDEHWRAEAERAGYVMRGRMQRRRGRATWRTEFFRHKATRCASCDRRITHHTGRIVTRCGGEGVVLSTCVACGPLLRASVLEGDAYAPPAVPRVIGSFVLTRSALAETARVTAAIETVTAQRRGEAVLEALVGTGMSRGCAEVATFRFEPFDDYVNDTRGTICDSDADAEALRATVQCACKWHWLHFYTWLPGAVEMQGCSGTEGAMCDFTLQFYGGFPEEWPWSVGGAPPGEEHAYASGRQMVRERLADLIVKYYVDNMFAQSLFSRMFRGELFWLDDLGWMVKIRAALADGPRTALNTGMLRSVDDVQRAWDLAMVADAIGGYRVDRRNRYLFTTPIAAARGRGRGRG